MQFNNEDLAAGDGRRPGAWDGTWPRSLARIPPRRSNSSKSLLSLALQGGGSFGAFTWGVLDHLASQERIGIDAISGSSAGAINAVVFANGLAAGGPAEARRQLQRFWQKMSRSAPLSPFGRLGQTAATTAIEISTLLFSPYQFNPLGLNPVREFLSTEVDFERLRAEAPVRLLIAATRVRDGRLRLFREDEISLEVVLASTAIPMLNHAVEIDGDAYWDGGLTSNPPLRQLVLDSKADDVMLVQVTPEQHEDVPRFSADITRRVSQIASNSLLHREIAEISDLSALCQQEMIPDSPLCRKLQRLRLHRVAAEAAVDGLAGASAINLDWSFLGHLREGGAKAAATWLATSIFGDEPAQA